MILAKDGKGDLAVWKDCACAAQTGREIGPETSGEGRQRKRV